MPRPLRVFLCHAKEDKSIVRDLYSELAAEGWIDVWLDEIKLLPGQEWDIEIEKAVEQADVVIVCLSNKSVDKEGYVQKELRFVLNISDEKPEGTIFVIPLRLDDCTVPRRIRAWQYVDYFPKNNQIWAYQRLLESLKLRATKLGIPAEDELVKAERKRKAKEDQVRIATHKAEADQIAFDKAEKKRQAQAERIRIARSIIAEPKKTNASPKTNFLPIFVIGGIVVIALLCVVFGVNYLLKNIPATSTPTATKPPAATEVPVLGIGSTMISEKDGMTLLYVPAGNFTMGSDSDEYPDEKPVHTVYLDSYWIDQTEVDNAMYAKCVADRSCESPRNTSSSTNPDYYGNSKFDKYPVIYVDWNMAKTYCEWAGRQLPTEAQWEKAASWDENTQTKRLYPWGNTLDCSFANYRDDYKHCVGDTTAVKSYESGKSFYGAYDMAGNVFEWISDWYNETYYQSSPSSNPLGPDLGQYRVQRGSSWDDEYYLRTTTRASISPDTVIYFVGFRCARSQ